MATRGLPRWPWHGTTPEALPPGEALLLACGRQFTEAARLGQSTPLALRLPLAPEDALGLCTPLDAAFWQLLRLDGLPFTTLLAPRVHEGEARLLFVTALLQRGAPLQGFAVLNELLPPCAAQQVVPHLLHLGQAMARHGVWLSHPAKAGMRRHYSR